MDLTLSEIREIAGPRLIGALLNSMLYGSLGVQVYFYYQAFPKDKIFIKYFVHSIFLLETVQTVMIFRDCFVVFTNSLTDPSQINNQEYGWFDVAILDGITGCIVQVFFAYRIFLFSRSKILPSLIFIISLTQGIASIISGIDAQLATLTKIGQVSTRPICVWLIGSAACDILIALTMTYYLSRCNSQVRRTQTLINKLIRMTIETGSLTASVATVDVVMFLIDTPSSIAGSLAPSLVLSKLYSNTALAILNSRRNLNDIDGVQRSLSAINFEQLPDCNLEIISAPEANPE